jgi:hypothetical protein
MEKDDQLICSQIAFHMQTVIMNINDVVYEHKADPETLALTIEEEAANSDTDEEEQLWGALLRYAGAIS